MAVTTGFDQAKYTLTKSIQERERAFEKVHYLNRPFKPPLPRPAAEGVDKFKYYFNLEGLCVSD